VNKAQTAMAINLAVVIGRAQPTMTLYEVRQWVERIARQTRHYHRTRACFYKIDDSRPDEQSNVRRLCDQIKLDMAAEIQRLGLTFRPDTDPPPHPDILGACIGRITSPCGRFHHVLMAWDL
jgi:hypothetical protein